MNPISKKVRVLVVEDQRIIALDLATTISRIGHEVVGIETKGERAVDAAEVLRPDLIFMDISLAGEIDGIEAARIINERFKIPVVYISGNHDESTIEKSKAASAYGYLVKPVEDNDISTIINATIYRHDTENKNN